MAVKSTKASASKELMREMLVLDQFRDCPFIIQRFGDDVTMDDGNFGIEYRTHMFLEYASGGTLGDVIEQSGRVGLLESVPGSASEQSPTRCCGLSRDHVVHLMPHGT